MKEQIKIGDSLSVLQVLTEPYVIYTKYGYTPVIDVEEIHRGISGYLVITASSLGDALKNLQDGNGGKLSGITISVKKESAARMARYIVEPQDLTCAVIASV